MNIFNQNHNGGGNNFNQQIWLTIIFTYEPISNLGHPGTTY